MKGGRWLASCLAGGLGLCCWSCDSEPDASGGSLPSAGAVEEKQKEVPAPKAKPKVKVMLSGGFESEYKGPLSDVLEWMQGLDLPMEVAEFCKQSAEFGVPSEPLQQGPDQNREWELDVAGKVTKIDIRIRGGLVTECAVQGRARRSGDGGTGQAPPPTMPEP